MRVSSASENLAFSWETDIGFTVTFTGRSVPMSTSVKISHRTSRFKRHDTRKAGSQNGAFPTKQTMMAMVGCIGSRGRDR